MAVALWGVGVWVWVGVRCRPIELHAHDAQRYAGDMLAWIHQAVATERELVTAYFGGVRANRDTPGVDDGKKAEGATNVAGSEVAGAGEVSVDTADGETKGVDAETTSRDSGGDVIKAIMTNIFSGVATPLQTRLLQALNARTSLLTGFKLWDLMTFYQQTVDVLVLPDVGLAKAIKTCRQAARDHFDKQLAVQAQKLVNSPPVRCWRLHRLAYFVYRV